MDERSVSVLCMASVMLWLAAFTLVGVANINGYAPVGQLGLLLAGLAIVLNVRSFVCGSERRQINAFTLGRHLGQSEVRSIR